jgi:hypothetical protein
LRLLGAIYDAISQMLRRLLRQGAPYERSQTLATKQEPAGTWVFVAPVRNVLLTNATHNELAIGRLTLVTPDKLRRCRKRFGIPETISHLAKRSHLKELLTESQVLATARVTGSQSDATRAFELLTEEELKLLALSQLGVSRRRHSAHPVIAARASGLMYAFAMVGSTKGATGNTRSSFAWKGKRGELTIDELWKNAQKRFFFTRLLRLLNSRALSSAWRSDIRRAALLAGESQCSTDTGNAFLLNMIAIELLLTDASDKYSEALPQRTESFLGWAADWKGRKYDQRIREVYSKRCDYVHRGQVSHITKGDLLFTDDLLFNIFNNIIRHITVFSDKAALIDFSNKVAAEKLLGMRPRVRPRTMSLTQPVYSKEDFE